MVNRRADEPSTKSSNDVSPVPMTSSGGPDSPITGHAAVPT